MLPAGRGRVTSKAPHPGDSRALALAGARDLPRRSLGLTSGNQVTQFMEQAMNGGCSPYICDRMAVIGRKASMECPNRSGDAGG